MGSNVFTVTCFNVEDKQLELMERAEEQERRLKFHRCFMKYMSNSTNADGIMAERRAMALRAAERELGYRVSP